MPNYSYNTIAIKGGKTAVLNFLNDGLKSKGSSVEELNKTTELLLEGLSMRSWMPMPQTFIDYDTTNNLPDLVSMIIFHSGDGDILARNFPNDIEDIRKQNISADLQERLDKFYASYAEEWERAKIEQHEKYGVEGWYNYNIATLGVKWDAELTDFHIEEYEDGNVLVTFKCETAWNMPLEWLHKIGDRYQTLHIAIYGEEESNSFVGYYDAMYREWVEEISWSISEAIECADNYETAEEEVTRLKECCFANFEDYICEMD